MWLELRRYDIREVPASQVPAVLPAGARVVVTKIPVAKLVSGDVIDFRHPTSPSTPLYFKVASVAPTRASSGYAVTLETGAPGAEAWHAELHGAVWRVVASRDTGQLVRDVEVARSVGAALGAVGVSYITLSLGRRWYRERRRAVARTYRTQIG